MKDKERRLYLLIVCFFVPTCGGIFKLIPHHKLLSQMGIYFICAQGFLNSVAVNEKIVQDALVNFYTRRWGKTYYAQEPAPSFGSPINFTQRYPKNTLRTQSTDVIAFEAQDSESSETSAGPSLSFATLSTFNPGAEQPAADESIDTPPTNC
eukprot:Phypoly_transcript_12787.p1 GENE.Phypoly_transcript_12787~~Phypoly_transcript_12787.p1  ORF type:complete len:152 (+),score=19.59 Phypoly_transcript_12787:588-1043(+)